MKALYVSIQKRALAGDAYFARYQHNRKHWRFLTSIQERDSEFRSDLGFISQVDQRRFLTGFEYRWYGNKDNWWNRTNWYSDWDITHNTDGELIEKEAQTQLNIRGPMQSKIDFGTVHKKRVGNRLDEDSLAIDGNTNLYTENQVWAYLEMQPKAGVFTGLNLRKSNSIDYANERLAQENLHSPFHKFQFRKTFRSQIKTYLSKTRSRRQRSVYRKFK